MRLQNRLPPDAEARQKMLALLQQTASTSTRSSQGQKTSE